MATKTLTVCDICGSERPREGNRNTNTIGIQISVSDGRIGDISDRVNIPADEVEVCSPKCAVKYLRSKLEIVSKHVEE